MSFVGPLMLVAVKEGKIVLIDLNEKTEKDLPLGPEENSSADGITNVKVA
jgi:hypothetical protein